MEITIVEPCPECGAIPNKFTATQGENDYAPRLHIECPHCGWTSKDEHTNPSMVLSMWNKHVANRRTKEILKACPFCGSGEVVATEERGYNSHIVMCNECLCRTDTYDSKEDAIEAWNRRPDKDA